MTKVLLTADHHLGITECDIPVPAEVRLAAFKRVVALARDYDILLIAGDLFDAKNLSPEIINTIGAEFRALRERGVSILYALGEEELSAEHDRKIEHFSATHVFTEKTSVPFIHEKDGQRVYVYSFPPLSEGIASMQKVAEDGFHIGLFHTDFDIHTDTNDTATYRLTKNDIMSLKLDFYALGHKHKFKLYKYYDQIIAAYAGSPEPIFFDETGDHYVLSLAIENNTIATIKRITVNTITCMQECFDCTGRTFQDILLHLDALKSQRTAAHLILTGERSFDIPEKTFDVYKTEFAHITVTDQTVASLKTMLAKYKTEDSLRGEFFTLLGNEFDGQLVPPDLDEKTLARVINHVNRYKNFDEGDTLCELFTV